MRILLINYEYPPLGGGGGNATANLGRELAALGADVRVLTTRFRGQPAVEISNGVEIRRVNCLRRRLEASNPIEMLSFMLAASLAGRRMAKAWTPHATIAFFGIPSGPVAMAVQQACGAPYLVSLRGGDVPGHQPDQLRLHHWLTGPCIRRIWRRAAAVIANSDGLREQALRACPELQFPVVHNGVDATHFSPAEPDVAAGQPVPERGRLLFVGRLSAEKGLQHLLPALATLTSTAWELTIVGDGPYRGAIETQIQSLNLAGRVHLTGWMDRQQLPDTYRQADLFVFPSLDEGMPNTVLEAMASALPVLATRIAGSSALVVDGETGRLVPPADPAALAGALAELLRDPSRLQRMGQAGRKRAQDGFTWQAAARQYLALAEAAQSESDR